MKSKVLTDAFQKLNLLLIATSITIFIVTLVPFISSTSPEFSAFLCTYTGFMALLLTTSRPVEYYAAEEQWGTFLFYVGGVGALLYHGIAFMKIPVVDFYPVLSVIAFHLTYSVFAGFVFKYAFWTSSSSSLLLGDSEKVVGSGEDIGLRLFGVLNRALQLIGRGYGLFFLCSVFIPQLHLPIPDVDPDFLLFGVVCIETLTASGLSLSSNINAPLNWFVNVFTLGFIVAWMLFGLIFTELYCPEGQECLPIGSSTSWLKTILMTCLSLSTFAYLILQFYVLVNWRQYAKGRISSIINV